MEGVVKLEIDLNTFDVPEGYKYSDPLLIEEEIIKKIKDYEKELKELTEQ